MEGSYIITAVILFGIVMMSMQVAAESKISKKNLIRCSIGFLILGIIITIFVLVICVIAIIQKETHVLGWIMGLASLALGILCTSIYTNMVIIYNKHGFMYRNIFRHKIEYKYDDIEWYQIHQDKVIIRVKDKEIKFEYATGGERFSQYIKKYKTHEND